MNTYSPFGSVTRESVAESMRQGADCRLGTNVRAGTRPAKCSRCGVRHLADGSRAVTVTLNPVTIECRACGASTRGKY